VQQNAHGSPDGRNWNSCQPLCDVINTAADIVVTTTGRSAKLVICAGKEAAMERGLAALHDVVNAQGEGDSVCVDAGGMEGGIWGRGDGAAA
jgi:hypothetical protein